jgi:2-methylcitrate dehydratase PrpD
MDAQALERPRHAGELVEFLAALSPRDVPAAVVASTRRVLLDNIGCGLFGATQEWTRAAIEAVGRDRSSGDCSVYSQSSGFAATAAAFCNGVATHGYELDDIIAKAVVHPGAVIVPAVLAAAQDTGASGERVVLGVLAGYEMMARLGMALGLEPSRRGYHTTGLTGPVAAATAVGVTMGLSADRLVSAIGLACSSSAGIKSFAGGSGGGMVKRMHAGRSAEAGVRMCQLADCGFEGPRAAIDGRFGLLEVMSGSTAQPAQLSLQLGQGWAVQDVWTKIYPICGLIQAVAQVLEQMKAQHRIDPARVARVRVGVSQQGKDHNSLGAPAETMAAQYSIPFCAGVALAGDIADPESFATSRLADPLTRALALRTEVSVDAQVEAAFPQCYGARVSVELEGGQRYEAHELRPHGTAEDPCDDEELARKFRRLGRASHTDAQLSALVQLVGQMEKLETLRPLTAALRPGARD